nr:Chain C, ASN-LEU-SER-ALA-LEU-GLY-ILE-PHE-SER-THR [Homo sapiens]7Q98_F Chain F, ASN-LEU-SER-ALA-LEU-GLY-ILE-PHE-SER-THR [Homo sapiens]7Q98_I Chain I, ASN-LEU-SER-ALA-LEU-GLY-ILE-PHE-SER-THR [Homo sapiens]7Q98_L Chain L, ASN-LEU-SER-ALA-LEU-GLY-ILE-PHE-SER-THR [Homo sapiens]7Q98_O Chain O, ASN-LEU-SER-ALA-LEU-GLY-ILE-PHE-SER-THR [Homo sapiens]7Q99_C Chain C, ASN-LEU-SER-ALA-LEU-GLY-ILE-PHE-SER-THR [Homo sapiens]
NLSALGIFST